MRAAPSAFLAAARRTRPCAAALALLLVPAALAGCGSAPADELPAAAEPARALPLSAEPVGHQIPVGAMPEGVVADPLTGLVAVSLRNPDRLALVDGRRRRLVKRVPIPESARHLALAGAGGPVLVPAERADALARVTLPRGRVAVTRVGSYPHDVTEAGGRIFVGDERGSSVTVLRGGRRVASFRVALQPGGLATLAGGGEVAVVSVRERVLELYDAQTLRRLARVPAGVGPTHVVTDGQDRLYVVDTTGDGLLVFHRRPRLELTRRVALPGSPYGLAVDPARGRLWATTVRTNEAWELSAGARPRPLRRFPTVRQPDTIAVDPATGRVFVTGLDAGVLQAFDPPPLPPR